MAKVRTILNDLCGEETSVADLYRTGKKKENVTRPRTLIVKLPNDWQYRKVLASTHKLKNSSDNVFISRELTKVELELEKSLLNVPVGHIWKFDLERSKKHLILE